MQRKVRRQRAGFVGGFGLYGVHHCDKLRDAHANPLVEERLDGCVTNLGAVVGGSEQALSQGLEAIVGVPSRWRDCWLRRRRRSG